jgi:hypothetical protein
MVTNKLDGYRGQSYSLTSALLLVTRDSYKDNRLKISIMLVLQSD